MNTPKTFSNNKTYIVAIIILVIVLCASAGYFYINQQNEIVQLRREVGNLQRELDVRNAQVDEIDSVRTHDIHHFSQKINDLERKTQQQQKDIEFESKGMRSYNYDGPIPISMNIPDVGQYCNGCFGGLSDPDRDPDVSGNVGVSGTYDTPTTDSNWKLHINYSQKGIDNEILTYPYDKFPNGNDSPVEITGNGFVNGADRTITIAENTPVSFKSVTLPDSTNLEYAFFEKDGYVFTFIFEYDETIPASALDDMLYSLKFEMVENPDYGSVRPSTPERFQPSR